jgi:hypothetical protein
LMLKCLAKLLLKHTLRLPKIGCNMHK